jgi:hypothetical protein
MASRIHTVYIYSILLYDHGMCRMKLMNVWMCCRSDHIFFFSLNVQIELDDYWMCRLKLMNVCVL